MSKNGLSHDQKREASQQPHREVVAEKTEREAAVGAVEGRTGTLETFKDRAAGFAAASHGDGAHSESYSKPGHGHSYGALSGTHGNDAHVNNYAGADHGHPGKATNPHDNSEHVNNYAAANHNHSQSIKLMGAERRKAAVELRERLRERAAEKPDDLIDGVLVLMALLFDDAEEPLDGTLGRDADEQLVRHLWTSGQTDPGDVKAPPQTPHPDLDRVSKGAG